MRFKMLKKEDFHHIQLSADPHGQPEEGSPGPVGKALTAVRTEDYYLQFGFLLLGYPGHFLAKAGSTAPVESNTVWCHGKGEMHVTFPQALPVFMTWTSTLEDYVAKGRESQKEAVHPRLPSKAKILPSAATAQ